MPLLDKLAVAAVLLPVAAIAYKMYRMKLNNDVLIYERSLPCPVTSAQGVELRRLCTRAGIDYDTDDDE